jgi:signal transduction histidine kinase
MSKPEQPVILVVGEDEPTRSQFTRALTDAGCDVATAADGASALAIVDARPVSVMLLDHETRGMSARQIVEHLRAGAKTRSLPVILMTSAAAELIDAIGGLDASAFDYLVTSVDLPELVARVKAQVRVTRSEDRARRVVEGEDRARQIVETRRAEELRASNARLREALVRETKMVGELHELDRMKSNFVAQVSHEVRTPLTSIVGYVDLMLDGGVAELDPEHRKMLEVIGRNTQRLTTMVEDLLTVGEIESDAFSIKPILLDLAPIIEAAAKTVGGTATLQGIHVATKVASKLGLVNADAFQIERVLLHLLFNAVKFTFAGGRITISARRIDNAVVISVSDTGLGIPVAEQDRIFDRFYRCERSINDAAQGAGVGLAIAKAVVERHGGSIGVESAPDEGTTMTVTLPAVTHTEAQTMLIAPRAPVPSIKG